MTYMTIADIVILTIAVFGAGALGAVVGYCICYSEHSQRIPWSEPPEEKQ